jgi:hypothetical protein
MKATLRTMLLTSLLVLVSACGQPEERQDEELQPED